MSDTTPQPDTTGPRDTPAAQETDTTPEPAAGSAYIGKLRHEAAGYRSQLRDAQDANKALQAQVETLSTQITAGQQTIRARTLQRLAGEYLQDPAIIDKFIDPESIEIGDDLDVDEPALRGRLQDLVDDKPYLAPKRGVEITPPSGVRQRDPTPENPMAAFFNHRQS
ncbi:MULTISPECIES: hypothetical protein [Bifidobacterium]|jgi:hypothetical protein|uniref:Uncharacterized protein n=1 Tax=Bifidobacterium psychraerophilum TaxID=218140 RepID=A0A087CGH3_9BIFI|nr:hypothetical protein [Bifidobacterium psychraerophilum]KFI82373.1 hypothetical protein BPSY_1224 [Bifidobacterium psychraerophilum]PKA95174.1 hypothetical protein A9A89_1421 [Bifidobacterium psychraerophilum DSM 22366]